MANPLPEPKSEKSYAVCAQKKAHELFNTAFCIALLAFSAIPLGAFIFFAVVTGLIILGIAGTGVAVVHGGLVVVAGLALTACISVGVFLAAVVTFCFSTAYFGSKYVTKMTTKTE
ncbi:hypothetical protein BATDEDRAFT_25483 [Batrachochytrium dendrobatidis JAM81]|uniref:Uncharacterized protein n=1 Tax=Batrachochytrium dendrobatidis (strain JAM81 / FGSC 10211) TaxID=684364 RepID=F4P472_BATDJ|nr:uncharacterized protein BATDEDRAFT_25483 [Batrachochytrium dendrobatidis JAM81]EGF79736.1 hypothetical protein BATDEDRAFT_25483 [Batrachochytrium dendrobatidis JAM81]|eukprot:XP_006679464.1 hypothetical protein BATDEDRAFT_25483 [Batrachochytrium dendrobatidis JAM81]